jgi:hypothetical protein
LNGDESVSQPVARDELPLPWRFEPRPWSTADLCAVLAWTAALAWFFWDAVGCRGALFYFDITEINFPYRDFFARELRAGRFSRWCPGLYCGLPLYSESQAGYLHPLKYLLYPWMATWKAFNLDTVLSVWLTGLGTYGWLRRHVGAAGALTGAGVFGLGGFVWAHLIHTSMNNALTSVPLVVWALEWAWDGGGWRGVVLGAAALACQVFAGHLQDTILTAGVVVLYAIYRSATESGLRLRLAALGRASGVVALGIALAAVQWIPSKELLDRSPRAGGLNYSDLTFGSWHPELLPTLLVREAYGTRARDTDWMDGFYPYHEMNAYLGAIALALAVVGAAAYRDRWVAFWVILAGLGGLLMLGRFTWLFDVAHRIPIVGSSRIPVRFHLWVSVAVAAVAAVGVDRLCRPGTVRLGAAMAVIAVLALVSVPILAYVYTPVWTEASRWTRPYHLDRYRWLGHELIGGGVRTAVLGALAWATAAWASRTTDPRARRVAALLPLLVIADLLGAHWRDVPTIDPSYWTVPPLSARRLRADPSFQRVFGWAERSSGEPGYASEQVDFFSARDTLDWSLPLVWGLATSGGKTPIIPRRMVEYTDHTLTGQGRFDIEGVTHLVTGPVGNRLILYQRELESLRQQGRTTVSSSQLGAALGLDNDQVRNDLSFLRQPAYPGIGYRVEDLIAALKSWEDLYGQGEPAGKASIFRNKGAFARARLVGHPVYAADEREAIQAMDRLGGAIRERLVVEDPDRPLPLDAVVSGRTTITRDEPERVVVATESPGPSYLLLADSFDPGWSATLDGRAVPIRPADLAFRAVFVPQGKHTVVFTYRPAGFGLGLVVTGCGLAVALGIWFGPRRVAPLGPEHGDASWPRAWPRWWAALLIAVILTSTVAISPSGQLSIQERWRGSVHRFTWGAGIAAMKANRR